MRRYDFYTETDLEGVRHQRIIASSELQAFEFLLASGYKKYEITRLSRGLDWKKKVKGVKGYKSQNFRGENMVFACFYFVFSWLL